MDKGNQARILALKLYAMHKSDREWILSRVDPVAKFHLTALLEELNTLGIKVDMPMMASIEDELPTSGENTAAYAAWVPAEHAKVVDAATASTIDIIFDQEPEVFLRCLNIVHAWNWLADFEKNHVGTMHDAGHGMQAVPIAVKQALVKAVSHQLVAWESMEPQVADGVKPLTTPPKKDFILKRIFGEVF